MDLIEQYFTMIDFAMTYPHFACIYLSLFEYELIECFSNLLSVMHAYLVKPLRSKMDIKLQI